VEAAGERPGEVTASPADMLTAPSVLDLLELERLDRDLYRSTVLFDLPFALYGGQVAAQALKAAGDTVPDGRVPHSLHGYYLRSGDAAKPTVFRVDRDRDGRSFSARRVVAVQDGKVIFSMSASFHTPSADLDYQEHPAPGTPPPDSLEEWRPIPELLSIEIRVPPQPYPDPAWPTRFWARSTVPLPDSPLLQACVLTYVSDASTGLAGMEEADTYCGPTLDHSVWFHRPARMDDWTLFDLHPQTAASGRGWYTGRVHTSTGALAASLTQEHLFRAGANRHG
jgi:acyl-CoA thioesterase-2